MNQAGASAAVVRDATRELMVRWQAVRESWKDAKAEEFASHFLDGLPEEADRAIRVMADLERLISKIHGDCE
ncbi:UV DNA damage repair endonuclease [Haloferula luteola]|uniref:UV DNA damage repair endonuclease n=1 Tax=Haloferula luteola TaxID=595692 RepID=A0A840V0L4_9BACT|nr:hypothetical protein [Haloferula luteola]MBB5351542.1 UV DNA damage repair endonuclease [Haloferula luteola]